MNYLNVNTSGILAFWTLENQISDSGGNGLNLTPSGAVTFTSTIYTPKGSYAVGPFTGSNGLTIPSGSASLSKFGPLTDYRLEVDIYPITASGVGGQEQIFDIRASGGLAYGLFRLNTNKIRWSVPGLTMDTPLLPVNNWYHITVNNQANINQSLYVNRNLVSTNTATTMSGSTVSVAAGAIPPAMGNGFAGYIKNIKFFNQSLAFPLPTTLEYDPGIIRSSSQKSNTSGLIAWYTFENQARDSGPNGFHLIKNGNPGPSFSQNFNNSYQGQYSTFIPRTASNYYIIPTGIEGPIATGNFTIDMSFMVNDMHWQYADGGNAGLLLWTRSSGLGSTDGMFVRSATSGLEIFLNGTSRVIGTIYTGVWNNTRVIYQTGVNTLDCYLNGAKTATFTNVTRPPAPTGFCIGNNPLSPTTNATIGYIKNLKIWNYANYN